jgi:nucleoid-associated protein EbfC
VVASHNLTSHLSRSFKYQPSTNLHALSPQGNFWRMADLSSLFQLAQQAQGRLSEIQTKLAQETITAQAGGGMVQATADGRGQIRSIKIDPEALKGQDIELLEDLILAAVSQAQQRAAELYQAEVKKLTAGLPLPFQLPI